MLDTSTLSPRETKACTPSPTSRARSSSAKPMPPDWEATARPPTSGTSWRRVALRPAPLASTPCELGPTRRRLCARARASSSWRRSSLPLPEKPDEMTTAAPGSVGGGVAQHVRDPVGRHRDDDEVDRTVEVGQAADGRQPVDDVGLRVHHVHGAGVRPSCGSRRARRARSRPPTGVRRPRRRSPGAAAAGATGRRRATPAGRPPRPPRGRRRCAARPPPRPRPSGGWRRTRPRGRRASIP